MYGKETRAAPSWKFSAGVRVEPMGREEFRDRDISILFFRSVSAINKDAFFFTYFFSKEVGGRRIYKQEDTK